MDGVWSQPERRNSCVWLGSHQRGTAWSSEEAEKFPGSGTKGKKILLKSQERVSDTQDHGGTFSRS